MEEGWWLRLHGFPTPSGNGWRNVVSPASIIQAGRGLAWAGRHGWGEGGLGAAPHGPDPLQPLPSRAEPLLAWVSPPVKCRGPAHGAGVPPPPFGALVSHVECGDRATSRLKGWGEGPAAQTLGGRGWREQGEGQGGSGARRAGSLVLGSVSCTARSLLHPQHPTRPHILRCPLPLVSLSPASIHLDN